MKKLFLVAAVATFAVAVRLIRLAKVWSDPWAPVIQSGTWDAADDDEVAVWVAAHLASWDRP